MPETQQPSDLREGFQSFQSAIDDKITLQQLGDLSEGLQSLSEIHQKTMQGHQENLQRYQEKLQESYDTWKKRPDLSLEEQAYLQERIKTLQELSETLQEHCKVRQELCRTDIALIPHNLSPEERQDLQDQNKNSARAKQDSAKALRGPARVV